VLAAKGCANLGRRQHADKRQIARERTHLAPRVCCPVDRRKQQGRLPCPGRLRHPREAANRKTRPPRKTYRIDATLHQKGLDAIDNVGGHHQRLARGSRKQPLGDRSFEYIPARRQPQTPSGQPRRNVRHQLAARTDDKAQQAETIADLAGRDTTTLGAVASGLRFALGRRGVDAAGRCAYSR
jgi:hypothetical protein